MCSVDNFNIDLRDLNDGLTQMSYDLDDSFFEAVDAPMVRKGKLHVDLSVLRTGKSFDFTFDVHGSVTVPCDRCLDDMNLNINTDGTLAAALGEENSENEDLVTVDEKDGILNVAWYICEFIELAIPIKHVHAPGKCNPAMIETLNEYSATRSSDEADGEIDPRWNKLKELKTIIKD